MIATAATIMTGLVGFASILVPTINENQNEKIECTLTVINQHSIHKNTDVEFILPDGEKVVLKDVEREKNLITEKTVQTFQGGQIESTIIEGSGQSSLEAADIACDQATPIQPEITTTTTNSTETSPVDNQQTSTTIGAVEQKTSSTWVIPEGKEKPIRPVKSQPKFTG
jgi:hypothetical protein